MKATSSTEIVEENFKGITELIEDPDTIIFYKKLIVTCMEFYATQEVKKHLEIAVKNLNKHLEDHFSGELTDCCKGLITNINIELT